MNNIDLFNTKELEDKFNNLSSLYSLYNKYNFFFSIYFLFLITPFINFISIFFTNRVFFVISAFLILFPLIFILKYLFFRQLFSKFSYFSLTSDFKIEDISMFFLYKKDNDLSNTIFKYFVFEAQKSNSNFQHLQNIISNKNNHLILNGDNIQYINYCLRENFFLQQTLFNKLFLIKNDSTYRIIIESILKNYKNKKYNLDYFESLIIHFNYFTEQIIKLNRYYYHFHIKYKLLLNIIFRFTLENQKQLLEKLNLFISENELNIKNNILLKLKLDLEKHILKLDIKNF